MGCAAIPLLKLRPAVPALRQGIVVCIAVLIAAPLVWLSGGTVMQMTARSWLASPFYLASLVCLALALSPAVTVIRARNACSSCYSSAYF